MTSWVWILIAIAAIPLALWIIKVATAFAVPLHITARAYLKQQLSKSGIDPRTVPEACIDDFVQFAMNSTSLAARSDTVKYRAEVVRILDMIAGLFLLWRNEPESPMFKSYGESKNSYREIFERYGIQSKVS